MTADADALKCAIREVMDEREQGIPAAEHAEHHRFLGDCIPLLQDFLAERKAKRERWEQWRNSFVGAITVAIVTIIVGSLGWVGNLVWQALTHPQAASVASHIDKVK